MSDGHFVAPAIEELQPHFTQYAIEAFVAVGGMGAVYRAKQISVDRTVALKVLPPELAQDPDFRRRFAMEAKAMAKLSHRNLVQLYDFGQDGEVVWMTQEWVDGKTVFEVLEKEGAMEPMEAAALVAQACEGLGYAHKQGIVHRDVKPGNMMEGEEGLLKLMDFGLARATHGGPEGLRAQGGKRYATPEYAAPELWDPDREVDHRVDIFALGVLLFEALTGQRPGADFRKPSDLRAGLDKRFDDIVVRALQGKPENRYATCEEFLKALRAVVMPPAKTVPEAPTGQVKLMTGSTGAVKLNTSTGAVRVAAPRPTTDAVPAGAVPRRRNNGMVGVMVAVVVVLAIVAGGGALWWSQQQANKETAALVAKQEEAARVSREKQERIRRDRQAAMEARKKTEAKEREAARKAEEERKRQAAMKAAAEQEAHQKDPAVVVKEELEKLDTATRAAAKEPVAGYRNTLADLTGRFVTLCDDGAKKAAAAADLDGVIFWMKERAGVTRENPGEGGEDAPAAVAAMRAEWNEKLDPLVDQLEEMRSGYLEKAEALGEGELPDETRDMLAERWKDVSHLPGFMDFCEGTDPREPENTEVPPVVPEVPMPDKLQVPYEKLQKTLVDLEVKGDKGRMKDMIKSFGRGLAGEEKKLTMALQVPEAVAVRAAKNDLLEMLQRVEDGGGVVPGSKTESLVIVRDGDLTDHGEIRDRSQWKRKGRYLQSREDYTWLKSTKAVGAGDFKVRIRLSLEVVGASEAAVALGPTHIILDNGDGIVQMDPGGAVRQSVSGKRLASLVKPGEFFNCVVERTGTVLRVLINDVEALRTLVHARELGPVHVINRKHTLQLESLEIGGTMTEAPALISLTGHNAPNGTLWHSSMVPTGGDGLLCLYSTDKNLFVQRSRDGGDRWEDRVQVLHADDFGDRAFSSFGVAANPDRDTTWLMYAAGKVNQSLYLKKARSRGRSWSDSEDITDQVKEPGWDVRVGSQGVVIQRNKRKMGRILVPAVIYTTKDAPALFVLASESGREWSRIGPLANDVHGWPEIVEDHAGRLVITVEQNPKTRSDNFRIWATSEDGGDTWSKPAVSSLPNSCSSGGWLAIMPEHRGRQNWLYATVEGTVGGTNLTLFGSRDEGRTWKELSRFYYGSGAYPAIVPLGPERCGISFRSNGKDWPSRRIRFVSFENLWGQ